MNTTMNTMSEYLCHQPLILDTPDHRRILQRLSQGRLPFKPLAAAWPYAYLAGDWQYVEVDWGNLAQLWNRRTLGQIVGLGSKSLARVEQWLTAALAYSELFQPQVLTLSGVTLTRSALALYALRNLETLGIAQVVAGNLARGDFSGLTVAWARLPELLHAPPSATRLWSVHIQQVYRVWYADWQAQTLAAAYGHDAVAQAAVTVSAGMHQLIHRGYGVTVDTGQGVMLWRQRRQSGIPGPEFVHRTFTAASLAESVAQAVAYATAPAAETAAAETGA